MSHTRVSKYSNFITSDDFVGWTAHQTVVSVGCECVCVFFLFILDARLVDVPAGVAQEEGHTGFIIHLP